MHRFYVRFRADCAAKGVTNCLTLAGVAGHGYFNDMHRAIQGLTLEAAENIAVQGLVFLTAEPARLSRFLTLTGLDPGEVGKQAATPQFLAAVLEHLLADESLLLSFAANASVAPQMVTPALAVLQQAADGARRR
jgi:Protein of unknown function (DUF3572)